MSDPVPSSNVPSIAQPPSRPREWRTRVDLARLLPARPPLPHGRSRLQTTSSRRRVPGEEGHFLINAYGMTYERDHRLQPGQDRLSTARWCRTSGTGYGIKPRRLRHPQRRSSRPGRTVACVIHTHTPRRHGGNSAMECGLPARSRRTRCSSRRSACTPTRDRRSTSTSRSVLVKDLGPHVAMILKNHGPPSPSARRFPEGVHHDVLARQSVPGPGRRFFTTKYCLPDPETVKLTNDRYKPGPAQGRSARLGVGGPACGLPRAALPRDSGTDASPARSSSSPAAGGGIGRDFRSRHGKRLMPRWWVNDLRHFR